MGFLELFSWILLFLWTAAWFWACMTFVRVCCRGLKNLAMWLAKKVS